MERNNSSEEHKALVRERVAKIMKLKETLATLPNSIVLMPHTEEGHILCYMAFWTEKLMWMTRKKLGVTIQPEKLTEYSEKIKKTISKLYEIAGISEFGFEIQHTDDKSRLVNMRRSWVIAPRTPEGKFVASAVKVIDPMIVQLRATGNTEEVMKKVSSVIKTLASLNDTLRSISAELLASVPGPERDEVRYKTPRFVKKVLKIANPDQERSNHEGLIES